MVMTNAPKVLRYIAFGVAMALAVGGSAFIVGETFADPGGVVAALAVAAWVLPMVGLSAYALRRPQTATRALTVVALLVSLFVVLDATFSLIPRGVGPVGSIAVFAAAVALSSLGLHRPLTAGWLLVLLGALRLADPIASSMRSGGGPPIDSTLGGSSGAVAVPVLVIGALFLIAATWEARLSHRTPRVGSAH